MNPYYHIRQDEYDEERLKEYQEAFDQHINNMLEDLWMGADLQPSDEDFESDY